MDPLEFYGAMRPRPSSASELSTPLDKFTLFMELDIKIRTKIWGFSIVPALVPWGGDGRKVPSILHVHQESRKLALKHYWLAHWSLNLTNQPRYVHLSQDILYHDSSVSRLMPWGDMVMPPLWLRNVERMAVDLRSTVHLEKGESGKVWRAKPELWSDIKLRCPKLKELLFLLESCAVAGSALEDLVEVRSFYVCSSAELNRAVSVLNSFDNLPGEKKLEELEIKFMEAK
jgi:hypothetical protein